MARQLHYNGTLRLSAKRIRGDVACAMMNCGADMREYQRDSASQSVLLSGGAIRCSIARGAPGELRCHMQMSASLVREQLLGSESPSTLLVKGQHQQTENNSIIGKSRKIVSGNVLEKNLDDDQCGEKGGDKTDNEKRHIRC